MVTIRKTPSYRLEEKEEQNSGNCKAFCVTRNVNVIKRRARAGKVPLADLEAKFTYTSAFYVGLQNIGENLLHQRDKVFRNIM